MRPKFRVLFLCARNDNRSIFAEYFLRSIGADRFDVYSGGESPSSEVHPLVLRILREAFRIETADALSKSWHTIADIHFDFVITLSDDARECCPIFPGSPVTAHWSIADPIAVEGTENEKYNVFLRTSFQIKRRIDLFNSLPLEKLDHLQRELSTQQVYEE
jgi:arsenate reductase (thioredoxin)